MKIELMMKGALILYFVESQAVIPMDIAASVLGGTVILHRAVQREILNAINKYPLQLRFPCLETEPGNNGGLHDIVESKVAVVVLLKKNAP